LRRRGRRWCVVLAPYKRRRPHAGEMTVATTGQTITEREAAQVERANASSATPIVFVHGLWLLPSSWDNWVTRFEEAGYVGLTPAWPDDPETVEEARANPDVLAKKTLKQVADHTTEIINALDKKPSVIGHSTGGLLAQMLAGRVCRRSRWRSTPASSAAFCRCRRRC
jgi:pimeloyl-ACP methyl ester carboxylesterase